MKINAALAWLKQALPGDAERDAELLLSICLDVDRAILWSYPEKQLTANQLNALKSCVKRRKAGEPVAYILGQQEFWSLDLSVNKFTLIPRPETELLVELAIQHIPENESRNILDLGTGSGAVAIAIASERPLSKILAVDSSEDALYVANKNVNDLMCFNVSLLQSDWFAEVAGKYDVIVSNPPYVEAGFFGLKQLRFEPQTALVSGEDGLNDIRKIIAEAKAYLKPEGCLLLEHGYQQGQAVRALMQEAGFESVETHKDLAGLDRVTFARVC